MPERAIKNCPNCLSNTLTYDDIKKYRCALCGWEFYNNTAAAVAVILEYEGKIVAVRRNCEPGIGKLDFPGGFVDPDEALEEAVIRELREELNIEIVQLKYLVSAPNRYVYKNIEYSTCDSFFTATWHNQVLVAEKSEIAEILFLDPYKLDLNEFAFESMKKGLTFYLQKISKS